jgi:hypothetical protein
MCIISMATHVLIYSLIGDKQTGAVLLYVQSIQIASKPINEGII